ncbi:MAG: sodium:solute symporter [Cyclobacteriaceae bacterium]
MTPIIVFSIVGGYFAFLMIISFLTAGKAGNDAFYIGNRNSPWFVVAFGMIGASLSGVTFISVPGKVGAENFYYFQIVLGYLLGYLVIGTVLLPLYYKLKLVSIYTYLEQRFGFWSYKTGASFFLLSRIIGASFRLFLVAIVLKISFFDPIGVPFWVSVLITIALIWAYTFRGGIKTIVWTDTLQTLFMVTSVLVAIYLIGEKLDKSLVEITTLISKSDYSTIFNWNFNDKTFFLKNFLAGAFITIVMTGLDQDMMQKNLSCKNLGDAQKNMFWFSVVLIVINLIFLALGALMYLYTEEINMVLPERADLLFPTIALEHLGLFGGIIFLLGITAAAYSSADSALTALTTSFCVDILNEPQVSKTKRNTIHLAFSLCIFLVIIIFEAINDNSVIDAIFNVAGYTYGPLLGLYSFGLFTKRQVRDRFVPLLAILSPLLSYLINLNSEEWLFGYKFGFEILILNGLLTFIGLFIISYNDRDDYDIVES